MWAWRLFSSTTRSGQTVASAHLVDDPATAVDQDEQHVEGATPDRDRCPAGNQLAAMGYHLEATEFQGR